MRVSVNIILDTRRALKNNKYPVKLRLTHDRTTKYITTSYTFSESEFNKIILGKRLTSQESKVNLSFGKIRERADAIISEMNPYDFESFKATFLHKKRTLCLFEAFQEFIENLDPDDIAKRSHSKGVIKHMKIVVGGETFPLAGVTSDFISSFINHLRTVGRGTLHNPIPLTENTVNNYIAAIRSMLLKLISENRFDSNNYPLTAKHTLRSTSSRTVLTLEEMALFLNHIPSEENTFALDIFNFSYLASGMNMADIFRLKWKNIEPDRFTFVRQKTKRAPKIVTVFLSDRIKEILDRHGQNKDNPNAFVFECLKDEITFKEEKKRILYKLKEINKSLIGIAKELEIDKHITTYTARHSYATIMMSSEVPLAFISKQLGHANLASTQVYLSGFPDHKAREYSAHLIPKTNEKDN